MSKPYDQSFKLLAERYGREVLLWLGKIAPEDRVLPLEQEVGLPALFVDQLCEVQHDVQRFLVHLESQTRYKGDAPERMLWYAVRLYEKYRLPVHSVLLVLTPHDAPETIPDHFQLVAGGLRLEVRFTTAKLRQMDYREVLARGWTGLLALVPLMNVAIEEAPEVLRQCLAQAAQVADENIPARVIHPSDCAGWLAILSGAIIRTDWEGRYVYSTGKITGFQHRSNVD